jgi:16S rRNA processing protein RimM
MEDSKKYLKVGQIVGTRGIAGEMKLRHFCDTAEVFCQIKSLYFSPFGNGVLSVTNIRIFKNSILLRFDDVNTIDEAKLFIGKDIYSCKCDVPLPKGRYFIEDILGMDVIDVNSNNSYGKIFNIIQNGAHDVYCVKNTENKEYFLPAVGDMINRIDINNGIVLVSPIKGIFDD